MLRRVPALLLLVSAAPAGAQDEGELRPAWKRLDGPARAEVARRFEAEVAELDTLQNRLLTRGLLLGPSDPALLPGDGPLPYYDPAVHAPGLPIERARLEPTLPRVKRVGQLFFARIPERRLAPSYRYDWGSGEIRRTRDPGDPERVFENALGGYAPGADLVEAIAERALDDGAERAALAAFGHAYTDREGGVFPFTIYDAWSSGEEIEMPDIDNLGIAHDLLDE